MAVDDLARIIEARDILSSGRGRAIRAARRVRLQDVAREVGVSTSAVSGWERGECLPRGANALRYLEVIEAVLGASR